MIISDTTHMIPLTYYHYNMFIQNHYNVHSTVSSHRFEAIGVTPVAWSAGLEWDAVSLEWSPASLKPVVVKPSGRY